MKLQNAEHLITADDYRNALLALIEQASRSIRIRSSNLDPKLFNSPEINDALSSFARRSRYTNIKILIDYPSQLTQYRCLTLNLARRLSEKIIIKAFFDEQQHGQCDSWVMVDSRGVLQKPLDETQSGIYSLEDAVNTKNLVEKFDHEWGLSQTASQLRQFI
jgi:hypothetical protein